MCIHDHFTVSLIILVRVDVDDAIAMKKICRQQIGLKEETYTLILKDRLGSEESCRVQVKFDHGKPSIIYTRKLISGVAKVRVLLDILLLHRYTYT